MLHLTHFPIPRRWLSGGNVFLECAKCISHILYTLRVISVLLYRVNNYVVGEKGRRSRIIYLSGPLLQGGEYFGVSGRLLAGLTTTNYIIRRFGKSRVGKSAVRQPDGEFSPFPYRQEGSYGLLLVFVKCAQYISYIIFFRRYMRNIIYNR